MWKNNPLSFVEALALLFIGLKLTGHLDWGWWWVLSPLWLKGVALILFWLWIDAKMREWKSRAYETLSEIAAEDAENETKH